MRSHFDRTSPVWPRCAILVTAIGLSLLSTPVAADVRLAALFSDHAVLQRDRPLPIWGWADPGEEIRVKLNAETAVAKASSDGRWQVTLNAQPASKMPATLEVAGRNQLTIRDIRLGDVWLCSGQSNMEWGLGGCDAGWQTAADASRDPRVSLRGKNVSPPLRDAAQRHDSAADSVLLAGSTVVSGRK